jgi:hypothetical protein
MRQRRGEGVRGKGSSESKDDSGQSRSGDREEQVDRKTHQSATHRKLARAHSSAFGYLLSNLPSVVLWVVHKESE